MNRNNKNGMWLRKAELEKSGGAGWLLSMAAALAASIILLMSFGNLTGFSTIYTQLVVLAAAGVTSAIFGMMMKYHLQKWFFPGGLFFLLLLAIFGKRWLLDGFCIFWNKMGDVWTAGSGWVLPELALDFNGTETDLCLLLFSVFLGCMIAMICCGVARLELKILAVAIPVLVMAGMIIFHRDHTFSYLVPCLLTSLCILVCEKKGHGENSAVLAASTCILVLCCSCLMMFATSQPQIENWATGIGEETQKKLHVARYEQNYTMLPEGDFTHNVKNGKSEQTALLVHMETPEELYLRGFTGAVFDGSQWTSLDTRTLAENEELLYWLNRSGWNPHTFYQQAASSASDEVAEQTITVENVNACSRYMYVPYNLGLGEHLAAESLNTDIVFADGERIYSYPVISAGAEKLQNVLGYLKNSDEEDTKEYLTAEQTYRNFVYNHYLGIPEDAVQLLYTCWEEAAASYGTDELTPEQVQECVKICLEKCFPENGESEVTLPLSAAEGTSYQYATVAALTLRNFGIPARYAEGYVIDSEMAANAEEGVIKVQENYATAWVEVYQDGIGWIPADITQGIEKVMQNADDTEGDIPMPKPPKGKEQEEQPEEDEKKTEPEGGSVVAVPEMISRTLLMVFLIVGLLILAVILRRNIILKRRAKRWNVPDAKDAVGWIFADTAKLLEKAGLHRGNGSMWGLKAGAKQLFGSDYADEYEKAVMLNARSMFSRHEMNEIERETMKVFYDTTLNHLKEPAGWYKKLWMQWILCLY